jgi:hypothetical protein
MYKSTNKITWFILVVIGLSLTGCSTLKKVDDRLGEVFFNKSGGVKESEIFKPADPDDLTPEQKDKIDIWLVNNDLNRYGDAEGTEYASGTPLFHHNTGAPISRFEYILKQHPDILQKIN